jgi:hypothetical protein
MVDPTLSLTVGGCFAASGPKRGNGSAYGQWGPFLAGQTSSDFLDVDVFPNTTTSGVRPARSFTTTCRCDGRHSKPRRVISPLRSSGQATTSTRASWVGSGNSKDRRSRTTRTPRPHRAIPARQRLGPRTVEGHPGPLAGVLAYNDHHWNDRWSSSIGHSYTVVDNTNSRMGTPSTRATTRRPACCTTRRTT